jgi:hypothetical protein
MGMSEGTPGKVNAAKRRWPRRGPGARIGLCLALAGFILALFPPFAAAFTAKPLFGTVSATPSSGGATLTGTVYPYGLDTHYHFEYGTTSSYGTNVPMPEGDLGAAEYPTTAQAQQTVSGLSGTYHYRLVASNADGTTMSTDQTFTTTGPPPTVVSDPATETASGFTLSGTVNPNGSATTYRFEYGTTTGYGSNIPPTEASVGSGSSAVVVSQEVTGLLPSQTYHFRLTAHNSATASTSDRTFTTPAPPPGPPVAVVEAPIKVAGGYKLRGQVNPNNADTGYHFEFGKTTGYGTNLPATNVDIGSGAANVPVSQEATGLEPNTTYHYRVVAHSGEGDANSLDQAFTTAPNPPVAASLPATESPGGFVLNGTINPNGADTTYFFEFGITASYGTSIPVTEADAGSGTSPVSVSQPAGALPPGVPYHYRLVAHNAGGTMMGEDEFFMTPSKSVETPPSGSGGAPPPQLTPPPLVPSGKLTVRPATATASGAATVKVGVSGAGKIKASGNQLKVASSSSGAAGTVTLSLKLTGAGMKALKKAKSHKLSVKVTFVFQPVGGTPVTTTKAVVFRLKSG